MMATQHTRRRAHPGRLDRVSRRTEAGYAMVVVMIFTTLTLFSLMTSYEQLHQLFRFEETSDRIPSSSDGIQEALGHGLARLAAGEPKVGGNNRYECSLRLRDSSGAVARYRLEYRKLANNEWWLEAEANGPATPVCPAAFTAVSCPLP